ncbi:aminotransferase-like domain-containing protein [Desulfocurvus sp. DL9XJH121]
MPATPAPPYRYKAIEDHILKLLEDGGLRPGDRLPSLRAMGAARGVSVPTVAQAYAGLESRGVLESRERSGHYVRQDWGRLTGPTLEPGAQAGAVDLSRQGLLRASQDEHGQCEGHFFHSSFPHASLLGGPALARRLCAAVREAPDLAAAPAPHQGLPDLRRQLALRAMAAGVSALPDEVFVTTGARDGAMTLLKCMTHPGDAVLVQSPTYLVYFSVLEQLGLRAIEVPSCPTRGIRVDLVEEALSNFTIRACLVIANFHLDGSLTPDAAKADLVDLLTARGIPLIEDDVYGDLHFGPERPRLCKAFDGTGLITAVSSFSKTLAPGYRVGWALPGRFAEAFKAARTGINAFAANPAQMAVAEFLRRGEYERNLRGLRASMAAYAARLHSAIGRHFPPGTQAALPAGGICLWVRLPGGVDSRELFLRARDLGVTVTPGGLQTLSGTFDDYIRINCPGVWEDGTEEAVERLGQAVAEMMKKAAPEGAA